MQFLGSDLAGSIGLVLVALAGFALYIASRAAVDALVDMRFPTPGKLAIGHWLPIAAVALGAMLLNRPEIAVGVIFATSVASLSLGVGAVTFLHPSTPPSAARRTWPLALPTAMMAFLAGFRGELTAIHAVVLAAQGIIVCVVWNDPTPISGPVQVIRADPSPRSRSVIFRFIQLILAVALAAVGAWAAVRGVDRASHTSEIASTGLLAATLLSPLLVLPMLGSGVDLAHREQSGVAISADVGVVLLNIGVLLPMIIGVSYLRHYLVQNGHDLPLVQSVFHVELSEPPAAVPFALAAWRVDVVALIALSLFLVPVSIGKWALSKFDGLALIAGYAAYLLLVVTIGVRA
jgi:Ca2+/Na+ antiporter